MKCMCKTLISVALGLAYTVGLVCYLEVLCDFFYAITVFLLPACEVQRGVSRYLLFNGIVGCFSSSLACGSFLLSRPTLTLHHCLA